MSLLGSITAVVGDVVNGSPAAILPLLDPVNEGLVGKVSIGGRMLVRQSLSDSLLVQRVQISSVHDPDLSSVQHMRAAYRALTEDLFEPLQGLEPMPTEDALVAACEAFPPRLGEIVSLLKAGHAIQGAFVNSYGQSMLHLLCMHGDSNVLGRVLGFSSRSERGEFIRLFDPNFRDKRRLTPLHYAIINEHVSCINMVRERESPLKTIILYIFFLDARKSSSY
jgi:hypothetical protein